MNAQTILAKFDELLKTVTENALEQAVYQFFLNQLSTNQPKALFDAILASPILADHAAQPFLTALWDQQLLSHQWYIDEEKKRPLKRQRISSFKLIMGFYIFSNIDDDHLNSKQSQHYLQLGIQYQSFHCIYSEICRLEEHYSSNPSVALLTKLLALAQESFVHLTPGYLLYAKLCWQYSARDEQLKVRGLEALWVAQLLEKYSTNELYNAFFGEPCSIGGMNDIHQMIAIYINQQLMPQEAVNAAKRVAEQTCLTLAGNINSLHS